MARMGREGFGERTLDGVILEPKKSKRREWTRPAVFEELDAEVILPKDWVPPLIRRETDTTRIQPRYRKERLRRMREERKRIVVDEFENHQREIKSQIELAVGTLTVLGGFTAIGGAILGFNEYVLAGLSSFGGEALNVAVNGLPLLLSDPTLATPTAVAAVLLTIALVQNARNAFGRAPQRVR